MGSALPTLPCPSEERSSGSAVSAEGEEKGPHDWLRPGGLRPFSPPAPPQPPSQEGSGHQPNSWRGGSPSLRLRGHRLGLLLPPPPSRPPSRAQASRVILAQHLGPGSERLSHPPRRLPDSRSPAAEGDSGQRPPFLPHRQGFVSLRDDGALLCPTMTLRRPRRATDLQPARPQRSGVPLHRLPTGAAPAARGQLLARPGCTKLEFMGLPGRNSSGSGRPGIPRAATSGTRTRKAGAACVPRPPPSAEHPHPRSAAPAHAAAAPAPFTPAPEDGRDPEGGAAWPRLGKTSVRSERAALGPDGTRLPAAGVHREATMSCDRVLRRPTKAVYPSPTGPRPQPHSSGLTHSPTPEGDLDHRIPSQAREATRRPLHVLHCPTQ